MKLFIIIVTFFIIFVKSQIILQERYVEDDTKFTRIDITLPSDKPLIYYDIKDIIWCSTAKSAKFIPVSGETINIIKKEKKGCFSPGFVKRILYSKTTKSKSIRLDTQKVIYVKRNQLKDSIDWNDENPVYIQIHFNLKTPDSSKTGQLVKTIKLKKKTKNILETNNMVEGNDISTKQNNSWITFGIAILFVTISISTILVVFLKFKSKKNIKIYSGYKFNQGDISLTKKRRQENKELAAKLDFYK